jgi:hypothetical protein
MTDVLAAGPSLQLVDQLRREVAELEQIVTDSDK